MNEMQLRQVIAQEINSIDVEDFPALYALFDDDNTRKAIMMTLELCEKVVTEGAYSTNHSFNDELQAPKELGGTL